MSVKSSIVYLTVEGASLHIFRDVTTDKVVFELDYEDGTYGTNLSFVLGNDKDEPLMRLLRLLDGASTTPSLFDALYPFVMHDHDDIVHELDGGQPNTVLIRVTDDEYRAAQVALKKATDARSGKPNA